MFLLIRVAEVEQWLLNEDKKDLLAWRDRLRAWNRSVLLPRAAK